MRLFEQKFLPFFIFILHLYAINSINLNNNFFYCKQVNETISPEIVCENSEEFGFKRKAKINECITDLNILLNSEDNDNFIKVFVFGNELILYKYNYIFYLTQCEKIVDIKIEENVKRCTKDLVISYLEKGKKKYRFLSKNGLIRDNSEIIECTRKPLFYKINSTFVLKLLNKHITKISLNLSRSLISSHFVNNNRESSLMSVYELITDPDFNLLSIFSILLFLTIFVLNYNRVYIHLFINRFLFCLLNINSNQIKRSSQQTNLLRSNYQLSSKSRSFDNIHNSLAVNQTHSLSLNNLPSSVPLSISEIRLPSLEENNSIRLDNLKKTIITQENESLTAESNLIEKPKKKRGRPRKNLQ